MKKILFLVLILLLISGCSNSIVNEENLIRSAVLQNNPEICKEINDDTSRDSCYMQLATWNNDASFCDFVVLRNNIEGCFFYMAAQSNDVSLCDKLRNLAGLFYQKEACIRIAEVPNDKSNERVASMLEGNGVHTIVFITSEAQDAVMLEEAEKFSNL